jgi:hypothetical protein
VRGIVLLPEKNTTLPKGPISVSANYKQNIPPPHDMYEYILDIYIK